MPTPRGRSERLKHFRKLAELVKQIGKIPRTATLTESCCASPEELP